MPSVLTLCKSLDVLELVCSHHKGIGTRAIAQELNLNVATAHNIARTFVSRGYMQQEGGNKKFKAGLRLLLLGGHQSYLHRLAASAGSIVDDVARQLNESVMLAAIDHGHVVNLKYVASQQALRVHEVEDMSRYAYCTAVGKLLLATLSEDELAGWFANIELERFTPRTFCTPKALRAELKKAASQGFAETHDEFCEGVSALAVPVRDPWGATVAAIGASAPTLRLRKTAQFENARDELRAAAARLEARWAASDETES